MKNEKEMSFEELYKQTLKEEKLGTTVTGKIISITSKGEIFVDIGYKADGIILKSEYTENEVPLVDFKVGDEITADVIKQNDGLGNVLLSYKKFIHRENKKELDEKIKNNEIIEGIVSEINENGLIVKLNDFRIFIPLSLSGIPRNTKPEEYKNKKVRFRIIQYEPKIKKIIGSIKNVLDEEKEKREKEFWSNIEIGQARKGIVTSLSSYGAFVDVDGVQGLLHISEISWARNVKPEEVLKQGQEIEVQIIDVDKENKRMKLSYGNKGPNPWNNIEQKYNVNDIVKVKVVKLMLFGAFVELEPGVEGLVHISQISERKIAKPEDVLSLGEYVNAKIIELDKEKQRIELSIKELEGTSNELKE